MLKEQMEKELLENSPESILAREKENEGLTIEGIDLLKAHNKLINTRNKKQDQKIGWRRASWLERVKKEDYRGSEYLI